MGRRRRQKHPKLVTGFYGKDEDEVPPEPEPGLPPRPCYRCGVRCQPVRFANTLICSACRRLALYGRPNP